MEMKTFFVCCSLVILVLSNANNVNAIANKEMIATVHEEGIVNPPLPIRAVRGISPGTKDALKGGAASAVIGTRVGKSPG